MSTKWLAIPVRWTAKVTELMQQETLLSFEIPPWETFTLLKESKRNKKNNWWFFLTLKEIIKFEVNLDCGLQQKSFRKSPNHLCILPTVSFSSFGVPPKFYGKFTLFSRIHHIVSILMQKDEVYLLKYLCCFSQRYLVLWKLCPLFVQYFVDILLKV